MVKTEKGVRFDMCKAWDDQKESGRREGKLEGIREGKLEGIREGKREGRREGKLEGIRVGKREEQKEGLTSLVNILATIFPDLDTIYDKIVSEKKYQDITREQVEKMYYAR